MSDRFSLAPISQLFGFHVHPETPDDRELGRAIIELDVTDKLHNPMGRVHGGVLAVLADAAMGIAFGRTIDQGQDFSTIDLHIHFMRPVRGKRLIATGILVQRGLRVGFLECKIVDERDREIANSTCSCMILDSNL